ncbi:MAG: DDE-type integrase/transposase/recombinase [Gemmatimonadaceae bacterium]
MAGALRGGRPRPKPLHPGVVRPVTDAPNDLWAADFKGQFRTGYGKYCYPLTLVDHHTRYLLACRGVRSTQTVTVKPIFERAFREHGLPVAIRTDNGAHERMHRTVKRQAIKPVRGSCSAQQRNFDAFRHEYTEERPHERLHQETPASQYRPSARRYPERLSPPEYPRRFLAKKITTGGTFRFQHKLLYLANAMVDHHIGLEETDDGIWGIYFRTILLATFDERDYLIRG